MNDADRAIKAKKRSFFCAVDKNKLEKIDICEKCFWELSRQMKGSEHE